ncbi:MAG: N-acetylmuramic acid 6-phosphate etherase [Vicinamibacterales bacterium]
MEKITEQESYYQSLEKMTTAELLDSINREDQSVPLAVSKCVMQIGRLVDVIADKMLSGGRLFYIGAGTSGRLGILDASECPPTYGVPQGLVVGLIAGGDGAIRKAVEFAEDSRTQGWKDLQAFDITVKDIVVGIAASGTTPYVAGALNACRHHGIITACIVCNPGSPIEAESDYPIVCLVGPEFVTGSTRMKSGTAQKLILNMISTSVMIKIGRVEGNRMVNMQLSNEKLVQRAVDMLKTSLNVSEEKAKELLLKYGSVKAGIVNYK